LAYCSIFCFLKQVLQEKSLMKIPAVVFFLALMSGAAQYTFAEETQWRAITEEGILHYGKGEYERAVAAIKKSLAVAEKQFGPNHTETATSLNNLAELYRSRGQYAQASPLYTRALAIREK
jgi:tetratricopeptide (TPR) repeat protein